MDFGERLRKLRKSRKLTQLDVADKIGISHRAYIEYEIHSVRPRKMETYTKLAEVLDCDINELLLDDTSKDSTMLHLGLGLGTSVTGMIGATAAILAPLASNIFDRKDKGETYDEWAKEQNRLALQYDQKQKQFSALSRGIILTELGKKELHYRVGEVKDLVKYGPVPDDYILIESQNIDEWWFVYWCKENRMNDQFTITEEDRSYMLYNRFGPIASDPRRKASIVLDDVQLFSQICKLKGRNSYRGYMTVILLDSETPRVLKEEVISCYDAGDYENRLPIIGKEEL